MKSNRFELEIESKLENLSIIADFITEAMKQLVCRPGNHLQGSDGSRRSLHQHNPVRIFRAEGYYYT
jgi:hypothetical protein